MFHGPWFQHPVSFSTTQAAEETDEHMLQRQWSQVRESPCLHPPFQPTGRCPGGSEGRAPGGVSLPSFMLNAIWTHFTTKHNAFGGMRGQRYGNENKGMEFCENHEGMILTFIESNFYRLRKVDWKKKKGKEGKQTNTTNPEKNPQSTHVVAQSRTGMGRLSKSLPWELLPQGGWGEVALTPPFVTAISRVRTLYYCVDLITEVTLLSA